jgi:dipeptidyl aminopeptidase/acylaminoacyl peptidase
MYALDPAWSPDGQSIAFSGRLATAGDSDPGGIYVIHRDGSELRRVVQNGVLPAWSPDGTRLVFERNKRLLTVKADGSDEQPMFVSAGGGTMPDWGKVAFWDIGDAFMDLYREQQKAGTDLWSTLPTPDPTATATPAPANTIPPPNPRPKCADARACVTSPRVGDAVTGVMPLKGSTNLPDFQYFKVEYRPVGEANWRWLMEGRTPVANGKIMDWHTYTVPKGRYEIRLTVVKRDGNYPEPCITRVRIY